MRNESDDEELQEQHQEMRYKERPKGTTKEMMEM